MILAERECYFRLGNVYVGNTPEDFLDDGALMCQRNVTINELSNDYVLWCIQPVRGQYITIRTQVYREYDLQMSSALLTSELTDCLVLCEVRVFVKGNLYLI